MKAKTTRGMPPRDQTAPGRPSTSVRRAARAQDVGLDPHGHGHPLTGPVCYWPVEDIAATVQRILDDGGTELKAVSDVGGKLIASVADADGNVIGLVQSA